MEKRISLKIDDYIDKMKQDIKVWIESNEKIDFKVKSEFLQFVYDYNSLNLEKEDFSKRKRVKSTVPQYLRCMAKRASGEQCTRKKKDESCYCGTHDKNRPHGVMDSSSINEPALTKTEVWMEEINGIMYYIDGLNNVYKTDEVLSNTTNPSVIAKYNVNNGVYSIVTT